MASLFVLFKRERNDQMLYLLQIAKNKIWCSKPGGGCVWAPQMTMVCTPTITSMDRFIEEEI